MCCGRFSYARDVRARAEEKIMKKHYFTKAELVLWIGSVALIVAAFCIWDRVNFLTLAASLIGVTSLIFCAKGNPVGQVLIIIFAVLYGIISWMVAYYGEMITYVGMTAPMAVYALIVWLKNPFAGKRSEVKVNRLHAREYLFMFLLAAAVTAAFYFILEAFHTANLIPSTISVMPPTTSCSSCSGRWLPPPTPHASPSSSASACSSSTTCTALSTGCACSAVRRALRPDR